MARLNVYVPDELAARARDAGLNVSRLTQAALEAELQMSELDAWLDRVAADPPLAAVSHEDVLRALDEARNEFGTRWDGDE
jgi:post-segregation antitoxin (ccd killing protein)